MPMKFDPTMLMAACGAMLALALLWFVLMGLLYRRLEVMHSEKYVEMGRPTLFVRNNLRTNYTTLKFLLAREHRGLKDARIGLLADGLLLFTLVYLAIFAVLAWYSLGLINAGRLRWPQ
ncbi:MAG: hypothetical protein V4723_17235 [Pseudomonadota bacterium]